jgi:L-ascorbate metabolism protein UlaG (beta-lactamase superfamily)
MAVLGLAASPAPRTPPEVRVTYLANEGVLIEGPCAVLVDALLRDSLGSYARHPPDVQEKLESARPPFDKAGLALATHYHLDHWDPGAIARFLTNNPTAIFASTPEATVMLPYAARERVKALGPDTTMRLEASGARVEAIPLEHGRTPHLAYRIDCGGRIVVHLGDASANEANYARLAQAGPADVALVPFWWLTDDGGRAFLKDRWGPKHIVAFHLGSDDAGAVPRILRDVPGAWICTRPGESRTY